MEEGNRIQIRGGAIPFSGDQDAVTMTLTPAGHYAFTSIYSGSEIAVIDLERREPVDEIPSLKFPDGIAYSPAVIADHQSQ
jgi:hypothetical protein